MRHLLSLLFFITQFGFSQSEKNVSEYAKSISSKELKELLYVYASDYFEGRETGKRGQHKAVDFIRQFYIKHKIAPANGTEYYFQSMTLNIKGVDVKTENVVAIIEGSEYPDEYIILSSHLDHIGVENGIINNGADDDGSGTVAMLEIAEAFQKAVAEGLGPKRSVVFLHVTGEEKGLLGSEYYSKNPLYPLAKPKPKFAKSIPPEPRPGIVGLSSVKDLFIPLALNFNSLGIFPIPYPISKRKKKVSPVFTPNFRLVVFNSKGTLADPKLLIVLSLKKSSLNIKLASNLLCPKLAKRPYPFSLK
ncbi:M28 family peptidase [Flavobacteriaceae bacterium]|nr:M28 family peptidase [Flavobacteriaceae bacterium]